MREFDCGEEVVSFWKPVLSKILGKKRRSGLSGLTCVRNSIHNLGLVGHIEDIAVAKDQQGKKLGLRIIQALDYIGQKVGCYKVSTFPLLPFVLFPPADFASRSSPSLTAAKRTKASM